MPDNLDPVVVDNPDKSRFELRLDNKTIGWAEYRPGGDSVIIAHTEIVEGHEGTGMGGVLVRGTIAGIRARGKTVLPVCPFAKAYVSRHPDLADRVVPSLRGR